MDSANVWSGEGRIACGEGLAIRAALTLHRHHGAAWSGDVVIHGLAAIEPGDQVELVVGRSRGRAVVREATISGGAGHRLTTLHVEGSGRPPEPLR